MTTPREDARETIRGMLDEIKRLGDENDALRTERDAANEFIMLLRRIRCQPNDEKTRDEVKALEPGNTARACMAIDLWNAMESRRVCAVKRREAERERDALREAINRHVASQVYPVASEWRTTITGVTCFPTRADAEADYRRETGLDVPTGGGATPEGGKV